MAEFYKENKILKRKKKKKGIILTRPQNQGTKGKKYSMAFDRNGIFNEMLLASLQIWLLKDIHENVF